MATDPSGLVPECATGSLTTLDQAWASSNTGQAQLISATIECPLCGEAWNELKRGAAWTWRGISVGADVTVRFLQKNGVQLAIGAGVLLATAVVVTVAPEAAPFVETALIRAIVSSRVGVTAVSVYAVAQRGYQSAGQYTNPLMSSFQSNAIKSFGAINELITEYAPAARAAILDALSKFGPT